MVGAQMTTSAPPGVGFQNPGPPGPPSPLGVLATVRAALGLYGADARELLGAMAIVIVPVQALVCILRLITVPSGVYARGGALYAQPGASIGAFNAITALDRLLIALAMLVAAGAAYRILLGRHLLHPAGLATSFSFALERAAGLLWVSILTAVVVIIGFICVIVPGIYLIVALWIAVPVLMAEDRRGFAALGRSRALISGNWWHALGCIIVAAIVVGVGEAVISVLGTALAPNSVAGLITVETALNTVVTVLFAPFTAAVPVVLYVDMLARKQDPQLDRLLA